MRLENNAGISKDISIVMPVYDEAENLEILCEEVVNFADTLHATYEIIFVEGGSRDRSFNVLCDLKNKFSRLVVIKLKRQYGQSIALATGIYLSRGKIIITMDADLQNDPRDIPCFIDKIKNGYDMACGWRKMRKDNYLTRILPSQIGNKILSRLTRIALHDFSCTFKAFGYDAAQKIARTLHNDFHRFIPVLGKKMNLNICEIEITHRPRIYGRSKYCFLKFIEAIGDFFVLNFIHLNKKKKALYFISIMLCISVGVVSLIINFFWMASFSLTLSAVLSYVKKKGSDLLFKNPVNLDTIREIIR